MLIKIRKNEDPRAWKVVCGRCGTRHSARCPHLNVAVNENAMKVTENVPTPYDVETN